MFPLLVFGETVLFPRDAYGNSYVSRGWVGKHPGFLRLGVQTVMFPRLAYEYGCVSIGWVW